MKSKVIIPLILGLLSFFAAACGEREAGGIPEGPRADVVVNVISPSAGTKVLAGALPEDANVNHLDVFIFRNGILESFGSADNSGSLALSASMGMKEIWAVVNGPDFSSVSEGAKLEDFKNVAVSLSDNRDDGFIFVGSGNFDITGSTEIQIVVSRLASRVVVRKITKDFSVEANQAKEFVVRSIYLTNVQGANSVGGNAFQADGGLWYNKMMYEPSNSHPYLHDAVGVTVPGTVGNPGSYEVEHQFFGLPNDCVSDVSMGTWSRRRTRLVIEASLDGEVMYYPITMSVGFERNKSYEFNEVVITKKGSSDPDKLVDGMDVAVSVEILPWDSVLIDNTGNGDGVYVF